MFEVKSLPEVIVTLDPLTNADWARVPILTSPVEADEGVIDNISLKVNTSGTRNTAVGSWTLDANVDGNYNTAIGYGALTGNTSADNNTALGYEAMLANTTGYDNVAVGKDALEAAANPASSKFYYYVSNGMGGHFFSKNLEEHNKNVKLYKSLVGKNN